MEEYWTAMLCTVHLSLGFVAAQHLARRHESRQRAIALPAIDGFHRVCQELEDELQMLPEPLQRAISRMNATLQTLATSLSKGRPTDVDTQPSAETKRVADGDFANRQGGNGSATEEQAVRTIDQGLPPEPERRSELRRYYPKQELLALLDDQVTPIAHFEPVQCHDLSPTGISFYLTRPLEHGQRVVVTLGNGGKVRYMAGNVCYSRFIVVRGEELYRIGCRFLGRLEGEEHEWKDQISAFELAKREGAASEW